LALLYDCSSLVILIAFAWLAAALWFQLPGGPWLKAAGILLWLLLGVVSAGLLWRGHGARAALTALPALSLFGLWWRSIRPSDARPWADDVARHFSSELSGDLVTLHDVRNFDWRTEQDYDARWETRAYDLRAICTVDVAVSYWMGPAIAHTLVSFGFRDAPNLVFSLEIRKERGERFSAVGGFFKQFECTLIAADERDILRVRTNVRGEDVYLYRIAAIDSMSMRSLFLAYLKEGAALRREPRWYNTLTTNCTTVVYDMARHVVGGLPLDYRLLLSGYLPGYLYDVGALTRGADFALLSRAGRITERAKAADADPAFSERIRAGVPGMDG
jgi:hypothetical protein